MTFATLTISAGLITPRGCAHVTTLAVTIKTATTNNFLVVIFNLPGFALVLYGFGEGDAAGAGSTIFMVVRSVSHAVANFLISRSGPKSVITMTRPPTTAQ